MVFRKGLRQINAVTGHDQGSLCEEVLWKSVMYKEDMHWPCTWMIMLSLELSGV